MLTQGHYLMPQILYHDQHTSKEEVFQHQALIQRILSGGKTNIKKLANMDYQGNPVYRATTNNNARNKYRLVYTYVSNEGRRTFMALTVMEDHDYDKLRRMVSHLKSEGHQEIVELEAEEIAVPNSSELSEPLALRPAVSYKGQTLVFDESQQKVRGCRGPLVIKGAPGTGKTSLVYTRMLRDLNDLLNFDEASSSNPPKILFLTPALKLVRTHEKLYKQDMPDNQEAVVFSTWNQLLQSHYPEHRLIKETEFAEWLVKQKCNEPEKVVHYELSLIAALGFEVYRELGQRQCHYAKNEAMHERLLNLLIQWNNYLKANQLIDPMVSELPLHVAKYAAIYLDETQNLPPIALKCLIPLALNKNFISALDSDQCLISSPCLADCLKLLLHQFYGDYTEESLTLDWRSAPEITQLGNRLHNAKYMLDGANKRRPYKDICSALPTHSNEVAVSWVDSLHFESLKVYGKHSTTAVITFKLDKEIREDIKDKVDSFNILTPVQAIGLDYDTVILWNPFSSNPHITSILNHRRGEELSLEQWNALNALYVAIKRAQKRVFIYDEQLPRWLNLGLPQLLGFGDLPMNQFNIERLQPETSEEKTKNLQEQREHHEQEGNIELANEFTKHMEPTTEIASHGPLHTRLPIQTKPRELTARASAKNNQHFFAKSPAKGSYPVAAPSQSTNQKSPSTTLLKSDPTRQRIKNLLSRIAQKDSSAMKPLLEVPGVEHYLLNVSPKELGIQTNEKTIVNWFACFYFDMLTKALISIEKSTPKNGKMSSALAEILCHKMQINGSATSLLVKVIVYKIKDEKIIAWIKRSIDAQRIVTCLNEEQFLVDHLFNMIPEDLRSERPTGKMDLMSYAAMMGEIDTVKVLSSLGVSLAVRHPVTGNTPLHSLIFVFGNRLSEKSLVELLKKGDLTVLNDKQESLVHIAVANGNLNILALLMQHGMSLSQADHNGNTPAHIAAEKGYIEILKFLKRAGADLDARNHLGETPLHCVIKSKLNVHERCEVIQTLNDLGIDLNAKNHDGETSAFLAASSEDLRLLALLYQLGAKLDIANCNGETLTLVAVDKGNLTLLDLLSEWNSLELDTACVDGDTPGLLAAQYEDSEIARSLHGLGANFAIPNVDGYISTHYAAACGNLETIEFLHQVGVNLECVDRWGITPAFNAIIGGHTDIIAFLVSQNACNPISISRDIMAELVRDRDNAIQNRSHQWLTENAGKNIITPFEFAEIVGNEALINLLRPEPSSSIRFFNSVKPQLPERTVKRGLSMSQ